MTQLNQEEIEEAATVWLREHHYIQMFWKDIEKFNEMYRMPSLNASQDGPAFLETRLEQFKSILAEECKEIEEIIEANKTPNVRIDVALADLLGDIIVYCASEAKRWNIPIDRVLRIIMDSNFSKMGADGKPIYDERGKLLKGPNYWKPEPKIEQLLGGK